jgi:hypothetical protein
MLQLTSAPGIEAQTELFFRNRTELSPMQTKLELQLSSTRTADLQGVPPTHEHLDPGMELDSGSSNAMEIRPADAKWLIRNTQELNEESTRSDFLRNYRLCPDV